MEERGMNWESLIITAPRPTPTINRAISSLASAGFFHPYLMDDTEARGSWHNWFRSLGMILGECRDAEALLIVEDDAIFCKGLRDYLEETLWIDPNCALCSAYSNGRYTERDDMPVGWSEKNRGHFLVGSLCWAIPRASAEAMVKDLAYSRNGVRGIDLRIGLWALDTGRSVWYHKPSLVQHIGCGNSALRSKDMTGDPLWTASDFIGEDRTPAEAMA